MANQKPETLTDLLRERVSVPGGLTFRQLHERAYDSRENYRPSTRILHTLREGGNVMINPKLVRAVAAGLGLPEDRVQRAATAQFIVGTDVHEPDVATPPDTAARVVTERSADVTPEAEEFIRRALANAPKTNGGESNT